VAHGVHVAPTHADRYLRQLPVFAAHSETFFFRVVATFLVAVFLTGFSLRGGRASGLLATAAGRSGRAVVDGSIFARNWPVYDAGCAATSSGVPVTRMGPPRWPPSGPRSTTQSAVLITSRLCSITT